MRKSRNFSDFIEGYFSIESDEFRNGPAFDSADNGLGLESIVDMIHSGN